MRVFSVLLLAGLFIGTGCAAPDISGTAGARVPDFIGGKQDWLNSPPLSLRQILRTHQTADGKPVRAVLVDFWEYTCVNCIRTFPYLKAWNDRYAKDGLLIVGIHTPEFAFAQNRSNVAAAAKRFGLEYPIIIDSDYRNWNAWDNHYWPRHFLLDANGRVVEDHSGEGGYRETELAIQALLKKGQPDMKLPAPLSAVREADAEGAICYPVTPETYAGYGRGTLGNAGGYVTDWPADYRDLGRYRDGVPVARGKWRATSEALQYEGDGSGDYVALRYHAVEVNAVLRPEASQPVRVFVTQDGHPVTKSDKGADLAFTEDGRSFVLVDQSRMYSLVKNAKYGTHTLGVLPEGPGIGLYAYTFGSCTVASGGKG